MPALERGSRRAVPDPDPARTLAPPPECERGARGVTVKPGAGCGQRSGLNAARISVANSSGSSQAAKWPPLSASWK
jgi:hypothetical protein